jgi:excisionase family DNA binding protein
VSNSPEVPRWLPIAQAAAYLGVSAQTIRSILHRGEIRASRLSEGSPYLLDRLDLDRFLERRKRILPPYRKGTRPWVKEGKPWLKRAVAS